MIKNENIIKFTVSEEQWKLGHSIGMARYNSKNRYSSTRNLSKINTHVCGAVAEVIFGQWQGFPINECIDQIHGDKFDFVSRYGETIDIKQSTFSGHDIELKETVDNVLKNKIKDIYVLCRAIMGFNRITEVHMIGWIDKDNFIRSEHIREPYVLWDKRYPRNYVVGINKLKPFIGKMFGQELDIFLNALS